MLLYTNLSFSEGNNINDPDCIDAATQYSTNPEIDAQIILFNCLYKHKNIIDYVNSELSIRSFYNIISTQRDSEENETSTPSQTERYSVSNNSCNCAICSNQCTGTTGSNRYTGTIESNSYINGSINRPGGSRHRVVDPNFIMPNSDYYTSPLSSTLDGNSDEASATNCDEYSNALTKSLDENMHAIIEHNYDC